MCVAALLFTACTGNNKSNEGENGEQVSENPELTAALATQDSLNNLINDIMSDMNQIKELEAIVATPGTIDGGEMTSQKAQLRNDITAIREALAQRRERLAELENKLKKNASQNSSMLKTIEGLKEQIAQNETQITTLTEQLAAANIKIESLGTQVDSLNTTVANEKAGKEQAQQEAQKLTDEINTCYYALGSKSELQKHNIIKTGFLRKTKIMQGDYEMSYFTKADKRTLKTIPLNSKKAKVMTNQPADSYKIEDNNGQKTLVITDPTRFWNAGNFIVIEID
jgi:hypothetical protein